MVNQFNPYYTSSYPQMLPQQQIPTANGRASVDNLKLAPNSSILIADNTLPVIYRCVSDSIGNVSVSTYDISPHKDEEQVRKEQTEIILADLVQRIERLEHESNIERDKPTNAEHGSNQENNGYVKNGKQPTGNGRPNDAKQS